MKKIFMFLLIVLTSYTIVNGAENYLRINPKVKLGKYENGNHFLDFVPFKFNYHVSDSFSFSGGASVGFTAPRSNMMGMNHYMNRVTVRSTYRPLGTLGFFAEANFSNKISGANSDVDYFRVGNYQAIGVEIDWLELK